MVEAQYRAEFDAEVTFLNRGGLTARGFCVDVPHADVGKEEVGRLFVASLSLLMADQVRLSRLRIFPEPHKGTRGGPSDTDARRAAAHPSRLTELSHRIDAG